MEAERPSLSAAAATRISLTLAIATVLLAIGIDHASVWDWIGGACAFTAVTVIGKGYWRREVRHQVVAVGGAKVALMLFIGVPVFNFFLSALFLGAGTLIGLSWRAMT
ncbi:hypothetical protein GCM10009116_08670 [Brevundimonas basaltis]|uniref:Uncharacterized protein n=1 Tax=Brevundimonas basaltis TaxID=472166 RepID=A0A7W8HYM1_9CAUL|nr:hypothetical protein [Brevundimonas basaltis]MBB5292205.1 hypothetical protein [Brevundimonas basaltis]